MTPTINAIKLPTSAYLIEYPAALNMRDVKVHADADTNALYTIGTDASGTQYLIVISRTLAANWSAGNNQLDKHIADNGIDDKLRGCVICVFSQVTQNELMPALKNGVRGIRIAAPTEDDNVRLVKATAHKIMDTDGYTFTTWVKPKLTVFDKK